MGTKSSQEGLLFLPCLVSFLPYRLTWQPCSTPKSCVLGFAACVAYLDCVWM